jgi:ATP-dependent helicase/nuclease subunit A
MSDDPQLDLFAHDNLIEDRSRPSGADPGPGLPVDETQRVRIREERDATLFVEAGAGSGKTRALVDRVAALVLHDGVPMDSIAAITFTEKAAAELRDRIRQRFEGGALEDTALEDRAPEATVTERAQAALQQLDGAAVGTLHSFAQRILAEHPVEAGLPPGVEVLDEIGSQVEFEEQWHQFLDTLLDDASMGRSLLALEAAGVRLESLRLLAQQMTANWDLVEDRLDREPPSPPAFDLPGLLARFDEVYELRHQCTNDDDKLLAWFPTVAERRAELAAAFDEIDAMTIATSMGDTSRSWQAIRPGGAGAAGNWTTDVKDVRRAVRGLADDCDGAVAAVTTHALAHIAGRIGAFVLETAQQRRETGRLEFHDLLVQARRLLRSPQHGVDVRGELRARYTRLLLDEFQDTDPIQIELAALIASDDHDVAGLDWTQLDIEPGRLFLVGDPKQSIYRFRRADISVYLDARERFPDGPELTVNFRTVAPVIEWINHVFGALIQPEPLSQPAYVALSAFRETAPPDGPAVALLGTDPIDTKLSADQLRELETADIASTIAAALRGDEPWSVFDPTRAGNRTNAAGGDDAGWRPAKPSDVCILLPARTSLAALERALERAGVPYRAETSSLVYASREVRELMLTLRAVADPTDELATVAALRSFVYGCGDDDLANWRLGVGGRFSLRRELPEGSAGHPVADGLAHMAELHEARLWSNPAELLDRVVRERGVLESAVATGAPRDVWRRLRFVIDQARAWTDAGGRDLRAYLEWARLQGADNARVSETVLPETDDDSVRIMTIHGAKGLEFPITVLGGMTTRFQRAPSGPSIAFPPSGPPVLRLSARVTSEGYDAWQPIDDQMDEHERLRLLYVAATRARDHLVVCLHRLSGKVRTSASVLAEPGLTSDAATAFRPPTVRLPEISRPEPHPLPERAEWAAERSRALAAASTRTVIAATSLARAAQLDPDGVATQVRDAGPDPGLDKRVRDLDLPPWQKGRYGTAVGRAVHGVLQVVDLATGAGLDDAAAAQAVAEGVANRTEVVKRLAASGLASAAAKAAAPVDHWRELWVAAPVGERLIEGYIDLLYRTPDGLVVVDWKTDQIDAAGSGINAERPGSREILAAKVARYRLQGASYTAAVEAATGQPVARMVFVFLREDGATEVDLPDLADAVAEVRQRAAELADASAFADVER